MLTKISRMIDHQIFLAMGLRARGAPLKSVFSVFRTTLLLGAPVTLVSEIDSVINCRNVSTSMKFIPIIFHFIFHSLANIKQLN